MTLTQINTMVESMAQAIGCEYAYHHFEEAVNPPFIVFNVPSVDPYVADNINYVNTMYVRIELYTENKEPTMENVIEEILTSNEMSYEKTEVYITGEHLFEQIYELEVV